MIHKKIITLFLAIVFILNTASLFAFAADTAVVYGETVNTQPNSIFFVPVYIKNNTGLMGFKITVKYDPAILTLPAVSRGTVTDKGMLNDSVGVSEDGTIEIVWTNDTAVSKDGTLFVISFNVDEVEAESTAISLSFSQQDTFNEEYGDVVFDCKEISVLFGGEEATNTYQGEIKEPDYKDVIIAVDSAIKDMPFDSIKDIDRDFDEEILENTNETIGIMTGTTDYFKSVDEIIGAYKAASATDFVNTSCDAVDPGVIEDIINNAVQSVGAATVDEIPSEKKAEFVAAVEKGLQEQAPDINTVSDALTEDEAIEAIKSLKSTNESNQNIGKKVVTAAKQIDNLFLKIIIAAVAAIVVIFAVLALIIRKKQKKYEEAKTNEKNI